MTALVFDFEDINRRMNRKPRMQIAAVESVKSPDPDGKKRTLAEMLYEQRIVEVHGKYWPPQSAQPILGSILVTAGQFYDKHMR